MKTTNAVFVQIETGETKSLIRNPLKSPENFQLAVPVLQRQCHLNQLHSPSKLTLRCLLILDVLNPGPESLNKKGD